MNGLDLLKMLNGLDLFSGIGGLTLALREWIRPIAYCEIDPYCQGVLLSRMASGEMPKCPIWDDIRTLNTNKYGSAFDIIYGGFPCQDISIAGHGKGLAGKRSGLFFEIVRLAKEIKPKFLFLENVPAITSRGGLQVVREITSLGYDCRWCIISAASIGALHRRERWFLLAHAKHDGSSSSEKRGSFRKEPVQREQQQQTKNGRQAERASCIPSDVADTLRQGSQDRQAQGQSKVAEKPTLRNYGDFDTVELWQEAVSKMDKCSNGVPFHVARLRALGNSCVPAQAKEAFKILMGLK